MAGVKHLDAVDQCAVIEYGFAIPGLFRAIHAASLQADVPVMMALVVRLQA